MGHRLLAQVRLSVDGALPVTSAHDIAEIAHHELLHHISNLSDAIIHVDPAGVESIHTPQRLTIGVGRSWTAPATMLAAVACEMTS